MNNFTVNFYRKPDGSYPIRDFLDSLDTKMRAKVLRLISLLEENGNDLREPYSKYIGNHIFELRAIHGNNITRILYFFFEGSEIILTNGFIKKTKKTPLSEIQTARKYRKDFLRNA